MKALVKRLLALLGLEIRRKARRSLPYLVHYRIANCEFDLWIASVQSMSWYDVPEPDGITEVGELLALARPGDVVLEVGSHDGFFMMLLACRAGENGFVVGVEPFPQSAMAMQAQVQLNHFEKRCKALNLALSDSSCTLWIADACRCPSKSPIADAVAVKAVRGDDLLTPDALPRLPDLIKVDVEGHEPAVLRGCAKMLKNPKSRPKLAVELHPVHVADGRKYLDEMFELMDVEHYEGTMIPRVDMNDLRTVPFDPAAVRTDVVTNVFLRPKG